MRPGWVSFRSNLHKWQKLCLLTPELANIPRVLCPQVNGQKVTLPAQLRKDITVSASGKTLHLMMKAVFSLSYSWSQGATVTVSNDMAGKVCGACGPLSSNDYLEITEEMMQEYMAPFIAQDFPTW